MPMNRGDYENLSAAIADSEADPAAKRILAFDIADALTTTSNRFDPVRWLRDCEVGHVTADDVAQWTKRLNSRVGAIARARKAAEQRQGITLGEQ